MTTEVQKPRLRKLWLDDLRPAPDTWDLATSAETAIAMLKYRQYDIISLDHDLGHDILDVSKDAPTGLDVLRWIEEQVTLGFQPPEMIVHSMNPVGRANMLAAISTIHRIYADATAASMSKFHYELEQSQTHLDPEAAKILDDNLENLY